MKETLKVLLGINAVSLSHLLRSGPRQFAYASSRAFSAGNRPGSHWLKQIPEVELGDVLGDKKVELTLAVQKYEDGMLPYDQAMALLALAVAEDPAEVLEIGTYMGHTTRLFAENLPNATVHTVDLPVDYSLGDLNAAGIPKDDAHLIQQRVVGREYVGRTCESRIRKHFGDTASWDFGTAGNPTFFFIDGSHTYEYCKNDSEKCLALSGGKGFFVWHDCDPGHPGVIRFLLEWRALGRDVQRIAGTPLAFWHAD